MTPSRRSARSPQGKASSKGRGAQRATAKAAGKKNARTAQRPARPRPPKETLELLVGEPAHGGACVARDDSGRVVFVRHALPGETVVAQVTATQKSLAWADAIEILSPSPDRVPSVWPQAGPHGVGGGELAHVAPAAQRQWKTDVLRGQIRRIGGEALADAVSDIGGVRVQAAPGDSAPDDPLLHRRSRIELVANQDSNAGMHRFRDRVVLPLKEMPLAVEDIVDLGLFGSDSPWRHLWSPKDRIRVVASNAGDNRVLVRTPQGLFDAERQMLEDDTCHWRIEVNGQTFDYRVRMDGFWQTHREGAQVLAQAVSDAAGLRGGEKVAELYSGAGLFTQVLAAQVGEKGRVVSVEGAEDAVADATANCAAYGTVDTFVGAVDEGAVTDLVGELGSAPDVLVCDPPRTGAGREVCARIADSEAARVVLVSCDPAAGARDLRALTESGYELESLQAWDLFPHTHHVEFVAALNRR